MFTLVKASVYEEEIKKSRFIASAMPVNTVEDALAYLDRIREERATHHCWAYRIDPVYRFSDDGEPAGTAGKPILNAIQRQAVDGVMVVVIRYFGGIKLGAGGLARAYGGCAAKCLQIATLQPVIPSTEVSLKVGFEDIGTLYPLIERFGAEKIEAHYTENGLDIRLRINQPNFREMVEALTNASAGRIEVIDG